MADKSEEGKMEEPKPERKRPNQHVVAEVKLKHTMVQVDQVKQLMAENMEKVLKRDGDISEMDYRSEKLEESARQFEDQAGALRRKTWWEDRKLSVFLTAGILLACGLVFLKYFV